MSSTRGIVGYVFAVVVEKDEGGYSATCPGVGGVFEEADTEGEVVRLAIEAAMSIFISREKTGSILTEDGPYLMVLRQPRQRPVAKHVPTQSSMRCGVYMMPAQA